MCPTLRSTASAGRTVRVVRKVRGRRSIAASRAKPGLMDRPQRGLRLRPERPRASPPRHRASRCYRASTDYRSHPVPINISLYGLIMKFERFTPRSSSLFHVPVSCPVFTLLTRRTPHGTPATGVKPCILYLRVKYPYRLYILYSLRPKAQSGRPRATAPARTHARAASTAPRST